MQFHGLLIDLCIEVLTPDRLLVCLRLHSYSSFLSFFHAAMSSLAPYLGYEITFVSYVCLSVENRALQFSSKMQSFEHIS